MRENLLLVVVGGVFYVLGQYVATMPEPAEITVQGEGEVAAVPDTGTISLGVSTGELPTSDEATARLGEIFNAVVADLERLGIEDKDIETTNLSVQPVYDFSDGQRILRGYEATETVQVTIRNLEQTGEIVASATREGVNQVGGVNFEIDDPESLRQEAQAQAVKKARENAERQAQALGARIVRIKDFAVGEATPPPLPYFDRAALESVGGEQTAPPVPTGEQEVKVTVTVTYEIR